MNRRFLLILPLLLLPVVVAGVFWWQARQTAARRFEFTYAARIPAVPEADPGQKVRLWLPVPESDAHQEISDLTIEGPFPYELHRDPEYKNQYAYLEIAASELQQPAALRLRFRVQRREHRVPLGLATWLLRSADQDVGLRERYTKPDRLVPLDGIIAKLAEQETRGLTRPLDKARAIYDYVVRTLKYDKSGEGWGRGDALFACNARRGNCTDFHSLFIGMMRAAGIPARFEIGFPLPADKREGDIGGYHCWAQFYLDGVGWIPVDASEAWKKPEKRDYFFGAHDQHRVYFSQGRDLTFNPKQDGEPVNYFIYPYAELGGKPLPGIESKFSFRDLDPASR